MQFYLELKNLNNKKKEIAKALFNIWQKSYIIEKEIIGASIFPPLDRSENDFLKSKNNFYGIYDSKELAGVVEVDSQADSTHIQSLVVSPKHFRKGIATSLVKNIFELYSGSIFTVETGNDNKPAKKLYESLGFKKNKIWMTKFGVKKIRYLKSI